MPEKDPNNFAAISWLIVVGLSAWGGIVRYLMDIKSNKTQWSWAAALAQIAVSSFTCLIGGLVSQETHASQNMTYVCAGLCGAMGSVALTYFWDRFFGVSNPPKV